MLGFSDDVLVVGRVQRFAESGRAGGEGAWKREQLQRWHVKLLELTMGRRRVCIASYRDKGSLSSAMGFLSDGMA